MSASGSDQAQEAAELVDEYGGLNDFVRQFGVGGILFAMFTQVIELINVSGELFLAPWRALAGGLADFVAGTLGQGIDIVAAGGETAVGAFASGSTALLGPFAFPFAVIIVMLALFAFVRGISNIELSPLIFIRERSPFGGN